MAPDKSICDKEITGCRVGMDNMYCVILRFHNNYIMVVYNCRHNY